MKNIRLHLVALIWIISPVVANAQSSDLGNWLMYFGNKQINKNFNWHHEVQYRNFNAFGDTEQLLLRTGIGYNLTERNNNILLGYGYIYNEPYQTADEKTQSAEHRIFQQFITRQSFGRFHLQHRYRFEQRFIESDFSLRLRYFLSLQIAFNNKQVIEKTAYLSAYNEIFMNTKQSYYDRNRLYGGLGYMFSKYVRTEVGLMRQSSISQSRNQVNLVIFVNY